MKTQSAFVGADCAVHLNTKPAIDMKIALIVPPRNAKHDHPFRLDDALQDFLVPIFRVLFENNRKRVDYFLYRLVKLWFGRVLRLHLGHQFCNVISHGKVFCHSAKVMSDAQWNRSTILWCALYFLLGRSTTNDIMVGGENRSKISHAGRGGKRGSRVLSKTFR